MFGKMLISTEIVVTDGIATQVKTFRSLDREGNAVTTTEQLPVSKAFYAPSIASAQALVTKFQGLSDACPE
jgi:hypothetical protein